MRKTTLFTLALLCFVPFARAGEDASTAQVPKRSVFCVKVKSLDRLDALGKEWAGIIRNFDGAELAQMLETVPVSAMLAGEVGFDFNLVDRTKPLYLVMVSPTDRGPLLVGTPTEVAAANAWEGEKALKKDRVATMRGGAVLMGEREQITGEIRGTPTTTLDGDVVFHAYLAELVEANKDQIEGQFAQMALRGAGMPGLPEAIQKLAMPVASAMKEAVLSVESFDYAVTYNDGTIISEGFLKTKEGSSLQKLLQRAGPPGDNPLIRYLPQDAFVTWDFVAMPDWPVKELGQLIDGSLGQGAANAISQLISFAGPFKEQLTGRMAGSMSLGALTSASTTTIAELKEGTDPAKLFETFDVAKINAALKELGVPVEYALEKAIAKHGETELHRLTMRSDMPQMAMMLSMMQIYLAAENGHLIAVMSPTAEDDTRTLLDQIRKGEATADGPHAKAMLRLGRARNMGITLNFGALKQFGAMLGMFAPDAAKIFGAMPDDFSISTAVTVSDGHIRWRGNWPIRDIAKIAGKLNGVGKKAEAEEEEEFK